MWFGIRAKCFELMRLIGKMNFLIAACYPPKLNLRLTWNAGVGLVLVILGVAQAALRGTVSCTSKPEH